jgi:hypothetical protein
VVVSGAVVPGAVVSGAVVFGAAVSGTVVFGAVVSGAAVPGAAAEPGVVPGAGAAVSGVGAAVWGAGAAVPGVGEAVEAPGFAVMSGFELEEGGVVLGVVVVAGAVLLVLGLCAVLGAAVPDCPPAAPVEPAPAALPACISREVTRAISTGPTSDAAGPGRGVVVVLAPLQVPATFVALAT